MTTRTPGVALLAAGLLAAAAPAHAVTGTQSVTADVANTLEATFPGAYAFGNIVPGATGSTSPTQTVTVKSNASWGMQISSDIADGRMTEHTGAGYAASPNVLTNALQWRITAPQSTSFAAVSSTPATMTSAQGVTGDSGTAVNVLLKQIASFSDPRVNPNSYRVELTYDASQGY